MNTRTSTYRNEVNFFVKPLQKQESPSKKCANAYTYGFNGQERENEINNTGAYSAEYWFYDGRLGRRWNVDPMLYPWNGGYTCFNSNPIMFADPNGDKGTIVIYTLDQNGNKKLLTSKVDIKSYKLVNGSYYKQINLPLFKPHLELITYTKAYDYVQEVIIDAYGNYTFGEKKSEGVHKSYVEGDLYANMRAINLALEKDGIRYFLPTTKESNPTRNANDFEAFLLANIDQKELENLINAFSSDLNRYQDNVAVSPEQYEKFKKFRQSLIQRKDNLEKNKNKGKTVHCEACEDNFIVDDDGNPTFKKSKEIPSDTIKDHSEKIKK